MGNTKKRDSERAARVKKVADMAGVSERMVYMVLNGDRENESIVAAYMELMEGETALVEAVKELIPF